MRMFIRVILITSFFQSFTLSIKAAEIREFYTGVRSLGMGGAAIAVVNDETSLLVNPAGLGKLRDYFVTVADPEIEVGKDTQSLVGTGWLDFMDPQKTLDKVNTVQGRKLHEKIQLFPSLVVQNFGIGVYGNFTTDAFVDTTTTDYNLYYKNDYAVVAGFNFRLFDGRIKFGFNIKGINRVEIDRDDISSASTGLSIGSLAKEGFGIGSDVGLILSAPWYMLPTLAVLYRDAGNTRYNLTKGMFYSTTERPPASGPKLDAAIALHPILGKKTRTTFTVEYRDITPEDATETDINRRLHGGLEINFSDAFFIRGGMNQSYWTAGLELAMFNYQMQFATYGEEIGTVDAKEEDRRYVFKFAYRF